GYAPVFEARLRKSRGAITVHLRPNGLGEHRLGLSIGRRFGNAVTRSRFKRMIREVFRLERSRFPMEAGGGVRHRGDGAGARWRQPGRVSRVDARGDRSGAPGARSASGSHGW
ncbi:MAG: ribonuclease P protein component, partial [bacterium]|nr:ribonuclease P protein component [bacterium]